MVESKAIFTADSDGKVAAFTRSIPSVNDQAFDGVVISLLGPNGQQLSARINAIDFLNGVKSVFPDLLITLPS